MKEPELFKAALQTLCFTWGSDAPPEAVWAYNDLLVWAEKEYDVVLDDHLEEDLSNYDDVMANLTELLKDK